MCLFDCLVEQCCEGNTRKLFLLFTTIHISVRGCPYKDAKFYTKFWIRSYTNFSVLWFRSSGLYQLTKQFAERKL